MLTFVFWSIGRSSYVHWRLSWGSRLPGCPAALWRPQVRPGGAGQGEGCSCPGVWCLGRCLGQPGTQDSEHVTKYSSLWLYSPLRRHPPRLPTKSPTTITVLAIVVTISNTSIRAWTTALLPSILVSVKNMLTCLL